MVQWSSLIISKQAEINVAASFPEAAGFATQLP